MSRTADLHIRFEFEEPDTYGLVRLQITMRQSLASQLPLAFSEYVLQPQEVKQLAREVSRAVANLR